MKPTRLFSVIALALTLLVTLAISHATAAAKQLKPPPPIDNRILIKSIDLKASTVTLKYMRSTKAPDHTYKIDAMTQLKLNNVNGTIDQIKVGMVVDSYLERDNDDLDGLSLSGYGETPAAAKPRPPAKPKPTTPTTPPPAPTQ